MNAFTRPELTAATPAQVPQRPLRLLIATDAWSPQVNGVVTTLKMLSTELARLGVTVTFLTPEPFPTIGMPSYPEIRLALAMPGTIAKIIDAAAPDALHIATEGPIGVLARRYCMKRRLNFTTCFHTRFPDYVAARLPVPREWGYEVLRRFHGAASGTMVATSALRTELEDYGFSNLRIWQRGIDLASFLNARRSDPDYDRPIHLYVGRVAVEKNLDAFLSLDLPGSKVVVGDGPAREDLQARYPHVKFLGRKFGAELAAIYAAADVFVFPSRTDTFGLVMLEALACGTPVAAFPVAGPREVIGTSGAGCLDEDLGVAVTKALKIDRAFCRAHASQFTMRQSALSFLSNLTLIEKH